MNGRVISWIGTGLALFLILSGCADMARVGTAIGQQTGQITPEESQRIVKMAEQTEKAARPMTEQEEYYLGRAVAATILNQYRVYNNGRLTRYVNEIGQTVALSSDRPITYGGYHFALLDTEEINALSCPGGLIFITRGMLKQARNEEELAAILAHEVGHVSHRDGIAAIQRARWAEVVTAMGTEAAKRLTGAELAKVLSLFEGSVNDVTKTLLVNGYSRDQEAAADQSALTILYRAGYDPHGLTNILQVLEKGKSAGPGGGIFTTHPGLQERISKASATITENHWPSVSHLVRDQRFQQEMKL